MPEFGEIGSTGLAGFSGQIKDDFLSELVGKEGYKKFDEMRRNSAVIAGLLLAFEQPVRSMSWTYASEEGEEDPRLELLNASLEAMTHSLNDHIVEALTFLPFGYSAFEIVYQRIGSQILWRKFAVRGQDTLLRWELDPQGGLVAFVQQAAPLYRPVTIPIEKMVIYRARVERGNPEGRSILRPAWIPYYYAKHIQQIEAIGVERDLAGLPHIELPERADTDETSSTSDYSKAFKMVRNIRNDEQSGVITPFGWAFKLVSTGGSRQFDTDAIVKRYESRMLMASLAQFLMLGQDKVGSLALSRDQTDFFTMSINATADIIAETHTKYPMARVLALNGYPADGIKLHHTPAGDTDLTALSDFLQKVGSYITWTPEDEVWLRQVARLPEANLDELKAERERKQAAGQALQEALARSQPEKGKPPEDEDVEEDDGTQPKKMSIFTANPPDEDQRAKTERAWKKIMAAFLEKQQKRILKAAKELRKA